MDWTLYRRWLERHGFWALFGLLAVASLLPLWWVRVPPMQDIWQHLALVDVIRNYDTPGSIYPDYFMLPSSPRPNLVYYYGTAALGTLVSLETANKLVLSAYILAFPLGFLYLLRSFGKSRWLSLFSFPLAYNAMFGYGFVSFLLGMPILFVALGTYRRFVVPRGPDVPLKYGIATAALMVLAFFTHAHIYLLLCFLAGLLLLIHRDGWKGTLILRAWPFLPALAFFVPWFIVFFIEQAPSASGIKFGSLDKFFGPTYYRPSVILTSFFHYVGDYFRDDRDDALFIAMMFVAMVLLMVRRAPELPPGTRRKLPHFDLEVLTLALAGSVLALPQHIEAQAIVSLRHIVFSVLFFFGWLGIENSPRRLVIPAMATLVLVNGLWIANLCRGFSAFEEELDGYPALFEKAEGGQRLLKTTYNQESRVVNYGALWHMHFFYMLEKGGVSDVQFAEYPHNPIQYRPGMVPPLPAPEFYRSPNWRYFEYVLLRKSSLPPMKPVQDDLDLVADVADWSLYRVLAGPPGRGPEEAPIAKGRREELPLTGTRTTVPDREGASDVVSPSTKLHDGVLPRLPGLRRGIELPIVPGVRPGLRDIGQRNHQP